jgi:hypothetical protein
MRTTVNIADDILRDLRELSRSRKTSLTATVGEVLCAGLAQIAKPRRRRRYRQKTYDMGVPKVDITKALQLAAELETEEIVRKMEQGR